MDSLVDSIQFLQESLIHQVGRDLSISNMRLSIKRLELIDSMGSYADSSFSGLLALRAKDKESITFDFTDMSSMIIEQRFLDDLSNFTPLLGDTFNDRLFLIYDTLEALYSVMIKGFYSEVITLDVDHTTEEWLYIAYLSPRLSKLSDLMYIIIEGVESHSLYDDIDKNAISRMKELLYYEVLKPNESLYLNTKGIFDKSEVYVGSLLESGYVSMMDKHGSYSINQAVAITLKHLEIDKEGLFTKDELFYDENDYLRISLDGMINQLGVNRGGKFHFIHNL